MVYHWQIDIDGENKKRDGRYPSLEDWGCTISWCQLEDDCNQDDDGQQRDEQDQADDHDDEYNRPEYQSKEAEDQADHCSNYAEYQTKDHPDNPQDEFYNSHNILHSFCDATVYAVLTAR